MDLRETEKQQAGEAVVALPTCNLSSRGSSECRAGMEEEKVMNENKGFFSPPFAEEEGNRLRLLLPQGGGLSNA